MKKTLANYYLFATLLFSIFVMVSVALFYVKMQREIFIQNDQEIYTTVLENYKRELKNRVEIIEQQINYKKESVETRLKHSISTRVHEAVKIIESIYETNKGRMDEEAIKRLAIEALRGIRFNEGRGYYFIDSVEGNCLLFPIRPSDEGKNILHYQDVNGKWVIKEFIDTAKEKKEGFSVYATYKPGKGQERYQKITFVKHFERWNWVIGAGEYLDDVEDDIKREIAKEVSGYRTDAKENYINIFEVHNYEGGDDFASLIVSPNQEGGFYGKKISTDVKDEDGVYYRKESLSQINMHGEGFVTYKFKNLKTQAISPKISYFKKLSHWNWVISTGKQIDDIDANIQQARIKAYDIMWKNVFFAVIVLLIGLVFLIGISWVLSMKIKHDVGLMAHFLKRTSHQKREIPAQHFKIEEFKELLVYINSMIREIKSQHEGLSILNENLEYNVFEKTKELHSVNLSLEMKNKELEENYFTDTLTKLPNRNRLSKDFLSITFPQAILLDIDGFKHINDFYGTETGDSVLIEFAHFIVTLAAPHKMKVYRLSSDEFLMLYDHRFEKEFIRTFLQNMLVVLTTKEFNAEGDDTSFHIGVTSGVAFGKNNILEKADIALNFAKKKKLSFAIYDEDNSQMNNHKQNLYWRQKIQYALNNDGIVPYFQKIVDIHNLDVRKYECLIRLYDEEKVISPHFFLDVAKETKLYHELSRTMMEKSFAIMGQNSYDFSLNISLLDIENRTTMMHLKNLIDTYQMGNRLILELLESEEIMESDKFLPFVDEMKKMGVRFALDDFGSGYSNFSFMLKIAPSFIKIDGSLIKNINSDKNTYKVIQAIIAFAEEINAEVIAEFVENEEIVLALKACGVHLMQGYHFSMPSSNL